MKTILRLSISYYIYFLFFIFLQNDAYAVGENCATAFSVTPDENFSNQNFFINNANKTVWFQFIANSSFTKIFTGENATLSPFTFVNQIELFSGTCSSLISKQSQVFDDFPGGDRSLICNNLTIGQNYLVKLTAHHAASNIEVGFLNNSTSFNCNPSNFVQVTSSTPLLSSTLPLVVSGLTFVCLPNSTIIIDRDINFNTCKFVMYEGSQMQINGGVSSSAALTLTECWLAGCTKMWVGIKLQPGGGPKVFVVNSVIEDAIKGIEAAGCYDFTIDVKSTIFNRNRIAIAC